MYNKLAQWIKKQVNAQTPIGDIWFSTVEPSKIQEITGEALSESDGIQFVVFKGERYQAFSVPRIADLESFMTDFSVKTLQHAITHADEDDDDEL